MLIGEYNNVQVPAQSTLKKRYLAPTCDTVKEKIFAELHEKYIWLCVDKTTNACGTKVATVIDGGMDETQSMREHLIASKVLDVTNSTTIAELVQSSLKTIWGEQYEQNLNRLLLFITDAVNYMDTMLRNNPGFQHFGVWWTF